MINTIGIPKQNLRKIRFNFGSIFLNALTTVLLSGE